MFVGFKHDGVLLAASISLQSTSMNTIDIHPWWRRGTTEILAPLVLCILIF